jgi:hypothetical protein
VGLWVCYAFGLLRARKNVYIAPWFFMFDTPTRSTLVDVY